MGAAALSPRAELRDKVVARNDRRPLAVARDAAHHGLRRAASVRDARGQFRRHNVSLPLLHDAPLPFGLIDQVRDVHRSYLPHKTLGRCCSRAVPVTARPTAAAGSRSVAGISVRLTKKQMGMSAGPAIIEVWSWELRRTPW